MITLNGGAGSKGRMAYSCTYCLLSCSRDELCDRHWARDATMVQECGLCDGSWATFPYNDASQAVKV